MFHSRFLAPVAALTLGLTLAACGGGGGQNEEDEQNPNEPTPIEVMETTVLAAPEMTGMTVRRGTQTIGSPVASPAVGDLPHPQGQQTYRGIYGFVRPDLPVGARILSAELSIVKRFIQGDPMGLMGAVVVDHIDMGPAFQAFAYDQFTIAPVLDGNGQRRLLTTDNEEGRVTMDVTTQVLLDTEAGRDRSQFRIQGLIETPNGDQVSDLINLGDTDDASVNQPRLIIRYVIE